MDIGANIRTGVEAVVPPTRSGSPQQRDLPQSASSVSNGKAAENAQGTESALQTAKAESRNEPGKSAKLDAEQLKRAMERLNHFLEPYASQLKFTVDSKTNMDVVQVIDTSSKDVIRQIPSEEVIRIAESVEKLQGLLIRQTA